MVVVMFAFYELFFEKKILMGLKRTSQRGPEKFYSGFSFLNSTMLYLKYYYF